MLWHVAPLEALDQPSGFGGRKRPAKRCLAVDVEIILDEDDGLGFRGCWQSNASRSPIFGPGACAVSAFHSVKCAERWPKLKPASPRVFGSNVRAM